MYFSFVKKASCMCAVHIRGKPDTSISQLLRDNWGFTIFQRSTLKKKLKIIKFVCLRKTKTAKISQIPAPQTNRKFHIQHKIELQNQKLNTLKDRGACSPSSFKESRITHGVRGASHLAWWRNQLTNSENWKHVVFNTLKGERRVSDTSLLLTDWS